MVLLLSGCWHVPLQAIWRLRNTDALTVDPAGVRLAVRAPDWLDAPPGHVHLKIISHEGEPDEKATVFDLIEQETSAAPRGLAGEALSGTHFGIFRASAADAAARPRRRATRITKGGWRSMQSPAGASIRHQDPFASISICRWAKRRTFSRSTMMLICAN
jgi:hypothetical protein